MVGEICQISMGIVVGSEQSVAPATSPELYVTQFPPKKSADNEGSEG